MSTEKESAILTREDNGVFIITMNRPEVSNAVNGAIAEGMDAALTELDNNPNLYVGVITGAGKGFCSGMDLKAFLTNIKPFTDSRGFAGIVRKPAEKPLIAAVEGFAVAGGMEIALSCDLIVAAKNAKFGVPEVKRALVAAAGGLMRLPKRIPYHVAMHMAITGEYIDAQRAYDVGLVAEVCEPGEALEKAVSLARLITKNGPYAVKCSKAIIRDTQDLTEAEGWEMQDRVGLPALDTEDAKEGAAAFAERREPVWKGK
jgi:enoyl-CoA hydratase